uniref:Integrin beta n=1 Tax=Clastoptera arizonana TaxID=38151 RepID=A0A1B6CMD9_9HEMI
MELRLSWLTAAVAVTLITIAATQQSDKSSQNPCTAKEKCHECIQTPTCAWCSQPNINDRPRCFRPSGDKDAHLQCDEAYVYDPDNMYTAISKMELRKASSSQSSSSQSSYSSSSSFSSSSSRYEAVQISPQEVSLTLRINDPYAMSIKYAQAEDYPVDLYYLMDLSKSMEDDKSKLSSLGNELAQNMQNITSNFRLGFGSFVDKVAMPYVSTVPKNLVEPCTGCEAPYGFQNVMSLSTDTSRFAGEVENAPVSGNLDAPEGGFDAIMQAVVCRKQIGWREKARRLLVFSTDAGFHYAGDGKLGGIVKPNDGDCHLDSNGLYTHSTVQDYPSISQINLKVKENAINVIFAVTSEQSGVYRRLQDHIEGSSSGVLTNDSSNVVDLVKDQYSKISSAVEMKDTASNYVKVTYASSCTKKDSPLIETNKCDGLKVGTVVDFKTTIEVTSCPPNPKDWKQKFMIYPVGINESLVVNLEMLCDCPCEREGHPEYEEHSSKCGTFGTYKCGVCECDSTHFGRNCECGTGTIRPGEGTDLNVGCRPDNTTTIDCSGRGSCVCGQCECENRGPDERVSGRFCECDNFSCDRHNNLLCSGKDHGTCECGKCKCEPGWTGPACNCRASNDTCIPPGGGEICSGKGDCVCGECKCFSEESIRYSGRYCNKCPTCPSRCEEFNPCVQCLVYGTGPFSKEECQANCTAFVPTVVEVIEANEDKDEYLCAYYDEEDCRYAFVYSYDEKGKLLVRAQEKRECPPEVRILGIVLGVIGAIVLIGLALLLLWKLLTTIHDRREFAKFEKERMMAKWDTGENPIFKQATSTFKNPTYAGK